MENVTFKFLMEDGKPWILDKNLLFGKILVEKCMKMKEIELRGGARP